MPSPFTYVPLKEHDEIRLLALEPASNLSETLKGSLKHTTLSFERDDVLEPYVALSYVWGDPTPVDTIFLDGCEVGITLNLGTALRNIREESRTHRIWIDALCIDQACIPERNIQVSLMGQIYRTAKSTIIYLGELTPDVEFVFEKVTRGRSRSERDGDVPPDCPMHSSEEECKRRRCSVLRNIIAVYNVALRDLLVRPWFTRVWVFQELALSSNPWVQCGRLRLK